MRAAAQPPSANESTEVVVVEDEPDIGDLLAIYLRREGWRVHVATTGADGLEAIRARQPDFVILDVGLPGDLDGFDVCREIRRTSDVPVLFLTARDDEVDRILGLELGADDYVTKPYSPRELLARVRTQLRRAGVRPSADQVVTVGDLTIDPVRHEVRRSGTAIDLTPREFGLLAAMAVEPGRAFTRRQLLDDAVGFDHYALERTVDMHLLNLRRKIEDDPSSPRFVLTVKGRGYKLAES